MRHTYKGVSGGGEGVGRGMGAQLKTTLLINLFPFSAAHKFV